MNFLSYFTQPVCFQLSLETPRSPRDASTSVSHALASIYDLLACILHVPRRGQLSTARDASSPPIHHLPPLLLISKGCFLARNATCRYMLFMGWREAYTWGGFPPYPLGTNPKQRLGDQPLLELRGGTNIYILQLHFFSSELVEGRGTRASPSLRL